MRWLNCFILLLGPACLWSQSPVGFEDGEVQGYPGDLGWRVEQDPPHRWSVDSLNPISGTYSLHHSFDNSQAGCDYFIMHHHPFKRSQPEDSISIGGDTLSFSFRIRHGYPPSAGNNWQLAILAEFEGSIMEGIVVGVNMDGSDDLVRLWRARQGEYEELGASALNYQEEIGMGEAPLFRLTWQGDGLLVLWYASDSSGTMREIASCSLYDLPDGRSLVVRYEYSAAQDRKLWLDDLHIKGRFETDTVSPVITGWTMECGSKLTLTFSESVEWSDSSIVELILTESPDELLVGHTWVADSFSVEGRTLSLNFPSLFPNRKPMALMVHGICDRDGNCMTDTLLRIMRSEAEWGDLVFNEVMADPDPPVDLSLGEYVELLNRCEYPLNLEGWWIEAGDREYKPGLEGVEALLQPGEFLVVRPGSLSNQGSVLALYNREGVLIHSTVYSIPYDAPQWKKDGGWALESPDPEQVCNISRLWEYSEDRSGGTPGEMNSVRGERPDNQAPLFLYFGYESRDQICVYFSEPVQLAGELTDEVVINPGNFHATEVLVSQPAGDMLICRFEADLSLLTRYSFQMPAVFDCVGNLSRQIRFEGGAAVTPGYGSVLINEIMYDPLEGAAEYIELFNSGPSFMDIREMGFDVTDEGAEPDGLVPLSDRSRIMGPGEYLVLTGDMDHLMDSYGLEVSGSWVELKEFGSLPDGGGRIWLTDRAGNAIDAVSYRDDLHMELISDTRGISLERIDPKRPGDDPGNWHSAASIEGYATPGRLNSQTIPESDQGDELGLEPRVFSPDNDGYNDLLVISTGIEAAGSVIRLWITQPDGTPVRMLANNSITGASSQYIWDGRKDNGQMAAEGFYVVHFRGYNPLSGSRWNRKSAVGLVYR